MTDREAEAVLLALGDAMRWQDGLQNDIEARTDKGNYSIAHEVRRHVSGTWDAYVVRWYNWDAEVWEDKNPRVFTSERTAKIACERHYATGKWE